VLPLKRFLAGVAGSDMFGRTTAWENEVSSLTKKKKKNNGIKGELNRQPLERAKGQKVQVLRTAPYENRANRFY
jgi:hypothetical protein